MIRAQPGSSQRPDLAALPPRPRSTTASGATLVAREALTPALLHLTIRPDEEALTFRAGQYVQVRLMDGSPPRPYSIASRPGGRDLELVVALVEGGALTPRLFELPLGSRVSLGRPKGLFHLQPGDGREHLLVATGSGIAPLLSMVSELRGRREPPGTTLVHGARTEAELVARSELDRLARSSPWFAYRPTLSRPAGPGWRGRSGRVVPHLADHLERRHGDPGGLVVYLCGSPAMIVDCERLLLSGGVPAASIRAERFAPQTAA
jgi:CDP-4-dehydro-6-deoxyglucose reductase